MYNDFQIIADNIKHLRERSGITQEELAERAGVSVSHIGKIESGQRRPGMKTYVAILHALNVENENYTTYAIQEEDKGFFEEYRDIFHSCNIAEKKFLLKCLRGIKQNMQLIN